MRGIEQKRGKTLVFRGEKMGKREQVNSEASTRTEYRKTRNNLLRVSLNIFCSFIIDLSNFSGGIFVFVPKIFCRIDRQPI